MTAVFRDNIGVFVVEDIACLTYGSKNRDTLFAEWNVLFTDNTEKFMTLNYWRYHYENLY